MSAKNSNLTPLGYDMVVATTQGALNATMLEYLSNKEDAVGVTSCFVWKQVEVNKKKVMKVVPITLEELLKISVQSNPFDVPDDADPDSDVLLQNLRFAGFAAAYRIVPGMPEGIAPEDLPNVIELGSESSSVTYNMLCAKAEVCVMAYAAFKVQWTHRRQEPGEAWTFKCKVDLRMSDVEGTAFHNLPAEIKEQIRGSFGSSQAFSVQQLLFDLDNAGLQTVPTLSLLGDQNDSVDGVTKGELNGSFLGDYFADMKRRGQPLLHVSVVSKEPEDSEFRATDMDIAVAQIVDETTGRPLPNQTKEQQEISTINYLCMSNNHKFPPTKPRITWNWMTEAESKQYHGVMAYQRDSFVLWLKAQLEPQVRNCCFYPKAYVTLSKGSIPQLYCGFRNLGTGNIVNQSNRSEIADALKNETYQPEFTVSSPGSSEVIKWHFARETDDSAGSPLKLGELEIKSSFDCAVTFAGNQITISQRLVIYMYLMKSQDKHRGNIIDWSMKDTYDLKVDDHGKLVVVQNKGKIDTSKSENPSTSGFMDFFNDVNYEIDYVRKSAELTNTNFGNFPIDVAQKFQFPGGKTFAFREFQFSDYQDLTAGITYVTQV